ncbi:DNA polymerase III subunit chi [Janthinobacterium sp. 17J80-10]|uniref:DNA polymerase III subunit chi n=1 Tax=Janthinobacterium sp. 17J80-10 TaxID=2497863 RepID=UPI0010052898|nr:DNA polymerase III subunit chi [Janthinobacterium sp. 17J80-10]QAU33880.1 DNA polymerase III subunit chi [Janthinobacterium sp. 17J80-10]
MTRIDFHSNVPDKFHFACRLVRKARAADSKIVLKADRQDLAALDAALWTFSADEFVPHVQAGDALAAQTPVILTADDNAELPHHQILINLSGTPPANFARFERLIEIVAAADTDAAAGRVRYKYYLGQGYQLNHFVAA